MWNLRKVLKTWIVGNEDWRTALNVFLKFYQLTPHSTTGELPVFLLFNERSYHIKLLDAEQQAPIIIEEEVQKTDKTHKQRAKEVPNRKQNAKPQPLVPGEKALIKQRQKNKTTLPCIIILNPIPLSKLDDQKLLPRNPTEGDHPTQGVFQTTPTSWKTQQASPTSIKVRYENFWQQQTIKEQYAWQ